MNVVLFCADSFSPLFEQLKQTLLRKHTSIMDVFSAPLVFVNNNFAQNSLEELILKENENAPFVGNIHFLEWTPSLGSLLEPHQSYLNPKTFGLFWGLFFYDMWRKGEFQNLLSSFADKEYVPSDFLDLGQYYFRLFKEYEIYAPDMVLEWKKEADEAKKEPHTSLNEHKELYLSFWNWLIPILNSLYGAVERNSFSFPSPKERKQQYANISDVHIFLPQNILLSQLSTLKEEQVLAGKTVYIYMICLENLSEELKTFYHKPDGINKIREFCGTLNIHYEEQKLELHNKNGIQKNYSYFSARTPEEEYTTVLGNLVLDIKSNPDIMLNSIAISLPEIRLEKRNWSLVFAPYKDQIPHHILYEQEKLKDKNYYDLLLNIWNFIQSQYSIEGLERCLKNTLLQDYLEFSDVDVEDLIRFLKSSGAWSDDLIFGRENQMSYHLHRYNFSSFLDIEIKYHYELNKQLVEFCLTFITEIKKLKILRKSQILTFSDIEEYLDFLEWVLPGIYWKELDDPYIRKDIMDIYDLVELFKELLDKQKELLLDSNLLTELLLQMNKGIFRGDNLSFAKNKGLVIGELKNLDVFPMHKLILTGFSEQYNFIPPSIFHSESLLPNLDPELELQLKYSNTYLLLELLQEAKYSEFSYSYIDSVTGEEIKPHIFISLLKAENSNPTPKKLSYFKEEEEVPKQENLLDKIENLSFEISVSKLFKYLQFPLEYYLKQVYGKSLFLEKERLWQEIPYFFSLSSTPKKLQIESLIYRSFYTKDSQISIQEQVINQGDLGLLRDSSYNIEQIQLQKQEIFSFLGSIRAIENQWGDFWEKIIVGNCELKDPSVPYLILEPPSINGKIVLANLSFCYLKQEEDKLTITLPVYKKVSFFPSLKMILNTLCVAMSLRQKGELLIQVYFPDDKEAGYKVKKYIYAIETIHSYFSNLVDAISSRPLHPFNIEFLKDFYKNEIFTSQKGWEQNYLQFLEQTFLSQEEQDALTSVFPVEYSDNLLQELRSNYRVLLEPLTLKPAKEKTK